MVAVRNTVPTVVSEGLYEYRYAGSFQISTIIDGNTVELEVQADKSRPRVIRMPVQLL